MNKFILTESERNHIRKMHGLISEDVNQDLLNYANSYIDNHNCDEIYNDLIKFQTAVNSGNPEMSSEDKDELSDNLELMKANKDLFCGKIKKRMKANFNKQSTEQPEKLKKYMCWFANNITNTELESCKEMKKDDDKNDSKDDVDKKVIEPKPTIDTVIDTKSTNNKAQNGSQMTHEPTVRPNMRISPFGRKNQ